ncbi:hypothetical protein QP028_08175 [Corynebacterium suedekumii]|nr:hypothetical protein QP028_08175 [Corynebacterium suedekumii]
MGQRSWMRVGLALFIIAFGANLFAPLLPAYRAVAGLSQSHVTLPPGHLRRRSRTRPAHRWAAVRRPRA